MEGFFNKDGELVDETARPVVRIKVIGVGGGGNNAVNRMVNAKIKGVELISVNTDKLVLLENKAPIRLQIGDKLTKGRGAGNEPHIGEQAAEESRASIQKVLTDADLVFVTAGMGGGTGTGAAPVIAKMAREMGILTIGVVTKPFAFEGEVRMANADRGINELRKNVDAIMVIPNDRLIDVLPENSSVVQNFMYADEVLRQGIKGICDTILKTDYINLDFADVKRIIKSASNESKRTHMGIGRSKGDNKVFQALQQAVSSPLLETSIEGAEKLLINFRCGTDLPMKQLYTAGQLVKEVAAKGCEIIYGQGIDETLGDEVEIILIAAGLKDAEPGDLITQPYFEAEIETRVTPVEQLDVETQKAELTSRLFDSSKPPQAEKQQQAAPVQAQAAPKAPAPETRTNNDTVIRFDDDDIPPFLRKIRK